MKIVSSLVLGLTALVGRASAAGCFEQAEHFHPDDWSFCQQLTDDIFLYYTPFEDQGNVMLGLHASKDAPGWSSLALAGNGGMKGASQIVVRKNESDAWIAEDRYSMDYTAPTLDEQQDVKLLFAEQDGDETSWGVLIPMSSCDDPYDYNIQDKTMYMHWALGSDHTFGYHGKNRGQFHANLLQAPKVLPSTEGLQYVDLVMPNVTVVLGEGGQDPTNPYLCSFFDLNELSQGKFTAGEKVHATRFAPVLAPDSKQYVHHMILYACAQDDDEGDDDDDGWDDDSDWDEPADKQHLQVVPECESMPRGCYEIKFPWAVGSGEVVLPDDVGMPIESRWLVLQVHYYNPNLDEGIVDRSGVRVFITPELKEQEAGVMEINGGTGPWQHAPIPAGQVDYHLPTFTIPSGCTKHAWNDPLNVLGVIHHMHLLGTQMEFIVERDGVNMGRLRDEHHYDFNHQSLEDPSPNLRSLLPGDQITMNCVYDTSTVTEDVEFGDLTQQEMCWGAVVYYPRQEEESFGYMKPWAEPDMCISPATDDAFTAANASLCAQNFFENIPRFFDFEDWVPAPFGALVACNGGEAFAELKESIPGLCPPCHETSNCTAFEVGQHAQEYCVGFCASALDVSTYPDLSDTVGHDAGSWGCPTELEFFTTPVMAAAPNCTLSGNLDQVIELKKVELTFDDESIVMKDLDKEDASAGGSSWTAGLLVMLGFATTMFSF